MPSARAVASARLRSREAIAEISENFPFCIPGMTFFTPILAVLRIPHRTLLAISGHHSRKLAFTKTDSDASKGFKLNTKTVGPDRPLAELCLSDAASGPSPGP